MTLSDLIRGLLPHGAQAARLGGDEFVILLRSVSGTVAQELGQNLRESFAQHTAAMFATPEPVSLSIRCDLVRPARDRAVTLAQAGRRSPLRIEAQGTGPDGTRPASARSGRNDDPLASTGASVEARMYFTFGGSLAPLSLP